LYVCYRFAAYTEMLANFTDEKFLLDPATDDRNFLVMIGQNYSMIEKRVIAPPNANESEAKVGFVLYCSCITPFCHNLLTL